MHQVLHAALTQVADAQLQSLADLLWGGGLITIAFTYFFGLKNIRAQSLMTAGLTGLIAFNLFLILVLDNPFHGYLRVTPEPLREILQRIQVIESS